MHIDIRDEREEGRYAAYLDGHKVGHATWVKVHDTVVLPHAEVEPGWEGRGIGSLLARRAFDDARADGLTVLPFCPFMKRWADLHPDYHDVVRAVRPGELLSINRVVHAARTLELLELTAGAPVAHSTSSPHLASEHLPVPAPALDHRPTTPA